MSSNKPPFNLFGMPSSGSSSKPPKPSASSGNPPVSSSSPQSGASSRGHGRAMISTLKGSMLFLQKSCGAFPLLGSAAGTLLEVIEPIEAGVGNNRQLCEMASDLPQWTIVLSAYLTESQPERMSKWVESLVEELAQQAEYIRTQQQRRKINRSVESEQVVEELERCYRRLESSFRKLQADANLSAWKNTDDLLKDSRLNGLKAAQSARYNSSFSDKIERSGCFANTRVSVLEGIRDWITGGNHAKIYWTNGMAGTGKTTIAYSVCTELKQYGRLGASFFCSRASPECRDVSKILPTIAYQMAQHFYPFRSSLCRILGEEPDIGECSILDQFEYLIRTPLLEVKDLLPHGIIIVIDALDECSDPNSIELMLTALFRHMTDLPVRFFLTSRPEPSIASAMLDQDGQSRSILHLHNVEEQFVKADIETYLTIKLAKLSLNKDQIKQLAEQAGILFIYASTVARYLLTAGRGASTSSRLAMVLSGNPTKGDAMHRDIDRLYKTILNGVVEDEQLEAAEVELVKRIVWAVVCAREPVAKRTLAAILDVGDEQISAALQPLRSVLHESEDSEVVSTLHTSFPDFILSEERSGLSLHCNERRQNEHLAARCFDLMSQQLEFNICGLETSDRFDSDVPNLKERVKDAVSMGLSYACRYWAEHLQRSSFSEQLLKDLEAFLYDRLLFWMEVLNLGGWMSRGPSILADAHAWLLVGTAYTMELKLAKLTLLQKTDGVLNTRRFVYDARNFVTAFAANPIHQSTPHIYVSALPITSRESQIWGTYWGKTRGLLHLDGTLMKHRGGAALAAWLVGFEVTAAAHSRNGTHIACGSLDGMIRIWETQTGIPLDSSLDGHTGAIRSVAFSSDGTQLVSGSEDRTVRLWDVQSGAQLFDPFRGHTDDIMSVAFSPNDTKVASGSGDCTIRIWDVCLGIAVGDPFKGHTGGIRSLSFCLDGTRIISGASDGTIRIWDSSSGVPLGNTLEGHDSSVWSVSFAPDNTRIASGSRDCTIRLWNAYTGYMIGTPLEGHTNVVSSIAFSSDSSHLVSGSWDCTIRLWETRSNAPTGSLFNGHTSGVSFVTFSSDNTRLISSSWDKSIRVWDIQSGASLHGLHNGHTQPVCAIGLSPDNIHVVSGSSDGTVRVWDAQSGIPALPSFRANSEAIETISFISNTRVVSGSRDGAVRVWNVVGGPMRSHILEGHTQAVRAAALSSNGAFLHTLSDDHTMRQWCVSKDSEAPPTPSSDPHVDVKSVAQRLRSSDLLRYVYPDDIAARRWHHPPPAPSNSPHPHIISLRTHPDSHFISLTASEYDAMDIPKSYSAVRCFALTLDGSRIASGNADGNVCVWDAHSGTLLHIFSEHLSNVRCVAFSSNGIHLASGFQDHTIWVWNIHNMRVAHVLKGHTDVVRAIAFPPDDTRIVSGSSDKTIREWDAHSGTPLGRPLGGHNGAVRCVTFSSDGKCIVSGGDDCTIRIWESSYTPSRSSILRELRHVGQGWYIHPTQCGPMLWLPIELRSSFPWSANILTISSEGSILIRSSDLFLGESWDRCYEHPGSRVRR